MKQSKVSVVIPVYNVEKYLRECLDSVCNQTLQELEIICVDDGSTDSSGKILDEYAAKDERIRVIHKENEGYGKTMNRGMQLASAEYIGIVESDDFIEKNMYEHLYKLMEEQQVDVIKADYYDFYQGCNGYIKQYNRVITDESKWELYDRPISVREQEEAMLFQKYTWSGLYRTEFLRKQNILHNETPGASYQDNGFWFQTMVKADKVYFANHAFYNYRVDNPNSSVHSPGKVYAVCDEFDFVDKILDEMGNAGELFYKWSSFFRIRDCMNNIKRVSEEHKLELALKTKADFLAACDKERVDLTLYSDHYRNFIFRIVVNPKQVLKDLKAEEDKILEPIKGCENIIIYGAGKIGQRVQQILKRVKYNTRIRYFAVSDIKGNEPEVLGIPVIAIDELMEYKNQENTKIIVAVGKSTQEEVETNLKKLGFENYFQAKEIM